MFSILYLQLKNKMKFSLFCLVFLVIASLSVGTLDEKPLDLHNNPDPEINDKNELTQPEEQISYKDPMNSDPISQEELETSGNKEVEFNKENSQDTSDSLHETLKKVILHIDAKSFTIILKRIIDSYKALQSDQNYFETFKCNVQMYLKKRSRHAEGVSASPGKI